MKQSILVVVAILAIILLVAANIPGLITELNNNSSQRMALLNAVNNGAVGADAFTTTALGDSVTIPGLTANSIVIALAYSTTGGDTLIFYDGAVRYTGRTGLGKAWFTRNTGGTSALKYYWIVLKW